MGRIRLLPDDVASQVAAGEVVERPASVVKELVENSLDAEARRIDLRIRRGGISLIQVSDDGIGMDRDDALLALERHATSKIRTGADLAEIATLGFRGEALPSIASVSRLRVATRPRDATAGTEIAINGGRLQSVKDWGGAPGTVIEMRSLFFNLPARRKFLRTEETECSHVEHQIHLLAIAHPTVAFSLTRDDRAIFQLAPVERLVDRIRELLGEDLASRLLHVGPFEHRGVRVTGLIGRPGLARASRQQQILYVNGRAVEGAAIGRSLREGYHTALMRGQYPVTFLFLDMDPSMVDVNVHPAKREVRFRDGRLIHEAIVRSIRSTLEGGRAEWARGFEPPTPETEPSPESPATTSSPARSAPETPDLIPPREQFALRRDWVHPPDPPTRPPPQVEPPRGGTPPPSSDWTNASPARSASSDFRILGVLGKLYVLMENAQGLVLVDQHAAHERILFEELRGRIETGGVPSQRLLLPLTIQLAPRDADWVRRNIDTLQRMGIGLEEFGAGTFKIEALPPFLTPDDPLALLHRIVDELAGSSGSSSRARLGEDVIAKTVCRHAVKARDSLRDAELVKLVEDLLACELPYCCPHGRPTMIQISYGELERKFGRQVQ